MLTRQLTGRSYAFHRYRRCKPLVSYEIIVKLIAAMTRTGPRVRSSLDENRYPAGRTVSDADMDTVHLRPGAFHGEWNYSLLPRQRLPLAEPIDSWQALTRSDRT